jgi:hypothetical protein
MAGPNKLPPDRWFGRRGQQPYVLCRPCPPVRIYAGQPQCQMNHRTLRSKARVSFGGAGLFHFNWNIGGGGQSSTAGFDRS